MGLRGHTWPSLMLFGSVLRVSLLATARPQADLPFRGVFPKSTATLAVPMYGSAALRVPGEERFYAKPQALIAIIT